MGGRTEDGRSKDAYCVPVRLRCDDGDLGIFVVNAATNDLSFQADLDLAQYGIPAGTIVNVDTFAPDGTSKNVVSNAKGIIPLTGSLPGHGATMFRVKPTARP